jgi:hypothetical protein
MPSKSFVERWESRANDSIDALEHLLGPSEVRGRGSMLADLLTRAEISSRADGYSQGDSGEKVSGGGGGTDATLGAALARIQDVCSRCKGTGKFILERGDAVDCRACNGSGRRWADPVGDAVQELVVALGGVYRACKTIDRARERVLGVADSARGRVSSLQGSCLVCEKAVSGTPNDRLRRGQCRSCFTAWTTWKLDNASSGDPGADFARFSVWQRKRLAERAALDARRAAEDAVFERLKHRRKA